MNICGVLDEQAFSLWLWIYFVSQSNYTPWMEKFQGKSIFLAHYFIIFEHTILNHSKYFNEIFQKGKIEQKENKRMPKFYENGFPFGKKLVIATCMIQI